MIEVRVTCDIPSCKESAAVDGHRYEFGQIVDRLPDNRFDFILDTEWMDPPKGWTLAEDETMRCPKHPQARRTENHRLGRERHLE